MQVLVHCIGFRLVSSASTIARRMRLAVVASIMASFGGGIALADDVPATPQPAPSAAEEKEQPKQPSVRMIGATTVVTEVSTGLPLPARVDTGATSCSIHCEAVEIEDANKDPKVNIGKQIRFLVKNKDGKGQWVKSKIVDYVLVRTAQAEEERYKVPIKLRWEDVEKKVHVTLNDRQHMKYPMLLGRNFLRDDFLVNVSLDANE